MKKSLLIAAALTLSLIVTIWFVAKRSTATTTTPEITTSSWFTYYSVASGKDFYFDYPSNWQIKESSSASPDSPLTLVSFSFFQEGQPILGPVMSAKFGEKAKSIFADEKSAKAFSEFKPTSAVLSRKLVRSETSMVNGMEAVSNESTIETKLPGEAVATTRRQKALSLLSDNLFVTIVYGGNTDAEFNKFSDTSEKMFKSVRLTK